MLSAATRLIQQFWQAMQSLRAKYDIDIRRALLDRIALLTGHAAADADNHIRTLVFDFSPTTDRGKHFFLGLFPNRTVWKCRPDDNAIQDSSLEVVLSDAAVLSELDPQLLAPSKLPKLWEKEPVTLADLSAYFSGKHFVEVNKGGYTDNLLIPAATLQAITDGVAGAVKGGRVWLVNGTVSVLAEDVPAGFINDTAQLFPPPLPLASVDVLPTQLPTAWQGEATNAHLIHAALSSKAGKVLPWTRVVSALDEAFRLGLIERTLDSGAWPCDLGGAAAVKIMARKSEIKEPPPIKHHGSRVASADLQTHEVQDLADNIDALREATAGHTFRIRVTVEIGDGSQVEQLILDKVNAVLAQIKAGWKAE